MDGQVIGGDASFRGFSGDVSVRTIGGSLGLRSVGTATVEVVGGKVTARQLTGALSVDRAGGGANVDRVQGDVRLRSLGGDVRLSRVEGEVQVSAGGDANVSLAPKGDAKSAVSCGGDLSCTIAESASVNITLIAGGDLRLVVPVESTDIPGGCEVRLGDSEAELKLTAGGDLILRSGSDVEEVAVVDLGEAIAARVGAEIEAHMYELEDGLSGLGDRLQSFDSEKIGNKIRASIEKAQRKAAKAQLKAARQRRTATTIKSIGLHFTHIRGSQRTRAHDDLAYVGTRKNQRGGDRNPFWRARFVNVPDRTAWLDTSATAGAASYAQTPRFMGSR